METKEEKQKDRRVLVKAIVMGIFWLLVLFLAFLAGARLLGEVNVNELSRYLSTSYGLWGIFLYNFLCEALTTPFPTNISFALTAQMDPWVVLPILIAAGYFGSATAFFIGKSLDRIPFVRKQSDRILEKWGSPIHRYGYWILLITGFVPAPFTTICLASGIMQLETKKVLSCLLVRVLRAVLYFYAFRLGLLYIV